MNTAIAIERALVSSYYAPRWKMYFDSLSEALDNGTPPKQIDWYAFGDTWNRSMIPFPLNQLETPMPRAWQLRKFWVCSQRRSNDDDTRS